MLPTALGVAEKLAAGPVDATRMTKRALNHWMRQALPNFEASLAYEMLNFLGPDAAEGLAALQEKRTPDFPSTHRSMSVDIDLVPRPRARRSTSADAVDAFTLPHFVEADFTVDWKRNRTEVTEIDRRAETLIVDRLLRERPTHGAFGEEHGAQGDVDSPWRWVIDPIDGTSGFVRGIPIWATLIALIHADHGAVLGVVSAPALGRRWWGGLGVAATMSVFGDERPIVVSTVDDLADAQVSITHNSGWDALGLTDALVGLQQRARRSRGIGDFWQHMLVAEGAMDVAVDAVGVAPYDLAAVKPIVEAAGGRFTDRLGARDAPPQHRDQLEWSPPRRDHRGPRRLSCTLVPERGRYVVDLVAARGSVGGHVGRQDSAPRRARDAGDPGRTRRERVVARAGAVGVEHVGIRRPRRRTPSSDLGPPRRLLQPLLEPDRAIVRAGDRRTGGRRGVTRLRVGDGRARLDRVRTLFDRQSHRRPASAVRGHARIPPGTMSTHGHRRHLRRRGGARRVRRRRSSPGAPCS